MTTTITRRIELAHRASDGIDVYLFWNEPSSRVTVGVLDFNHPYAYAARTDTADLGALLDGPATARHSHSNSQEPTINPWRTDHARTDR